MSQSLPCTFFILSPHFSSANLPSSSFCHPLFCSFDPLLTQSSSHTLLFIFIFFHPLPIMCHFICLQTTLFLLSTFITPFPLSQTYLTDLAPDFTTLTLTLHPPPALHVLYLLALFTFPFDPVTHFVRSLCGS